MIVLQVLDPTITTSQVIVFTSVTHSHLWRKCYLGHGLTTALSLQYVVYSQMSEFPPEIHAKGNYTGCWQCDSLLPLFISQVQGEMQLHMQRVGYGGRAKRQGRRRGRGN